MPQLRHPMTGAIYTLEENGLVRVELNGNAGWFSADGRWQSGVIRQADPHMLLWLGGKKLPQGMTSRRHRG